MDMAGVYGNTGSRADYFVTLDKAIQRSKALLAKQAQYSVIENIDMQLDAMRRWSANDRSPTDEERKRVSIGLIAVRELVDTGDPAMDEYAERISETKGLRRPQWSPLAPASLGLPHEFPLRGTR